MNSVDPMIFFSNILLIHQLLCANTDVKEGDNGSEYVYTEEDLQYDIKHLEDGSEQEMNDRGIRIIEYLQMLIDQALCKGLEKCNRYINVQIFYHELPKAIQFVYEAEKFSLYFSVQQEYNVGPMGGLKIFTDETNIGIMRHLFLEFDRVYSTIMVHSSLQNLSDVYLDLDDTVQQFDFITDLYLLNSTHKYLGWDCKSYNTVKNFINLEEILNLRTLKVMHMLVTDEFLEKVSNMTLESLNFTGCIFLTSKDTVQQRGEIEVAFGKSYETICFDKCQRYLKYRSSYALGRMHCIAIKINLDNCVKLRNLTVNMDGYASVILSKQIVDDLQYLSLGEMNCELQLSSSQCYGTRLEYLVIDIKNVELGVKFLREINRSELKHLVLLCNIWGSTRNICDVSDLFNRDFAALEVLEIDARYYVLEVNRRFTSEIKMKKLKTLKINCWCVNETLVQMITELEMLKHLEMLVDSWNDGYELVLRQLRDLKGPIEKLFVSSKLIIRELVRLIRPLNTLKEFYICNRSIWSSFYGPVNQNDDKLQSANAGSNERNLVKSKNVVHLKLHTLYISIDSVHKELIALMVRGDFEAFMDIEKLVIYESPTVSVKGSGKAQESFKIMQEQLERLIENVFETFKQLEVLVIRYKGSFMSEEKADSLRKFFSSKCRSVKERCEWSSVCDGGNVIFELYN